MVRLRHADSVRTEMRAGSVVSLSGLLDPVPRRRNPGDRDPRFSYCLHDITGVVTAEGADVKGAVAGDPSIGGIVASVRRKLGEILERHHEGEIRSYLKGIVLAMRSEMSDEQREAFLVSGTFHVIAVSGLHVGLITVMLHAVLGLFSLPRKALPIATMAGVLAYVVSVGSSPSVVRAVIMACVVLGGRLVERPVDVFQSLGVAGSIVMLLDPVQLFDPGFQLSFAAVFAIVTLFPLWSHSLEHVRSRTIAGRIVRAGIQLLMVSLAAQLGTLPLTILLFERISLVSLAANLVIVPMSSLNVALGIATLALDSVAGFLAAPYAALNDLVALGVLASARMASHIPGAAVSSAGWSVFSACALSVGLIGILSLRRPAIVRATLLSLLALADAWLFSGLTDVPVRELRVTLLDVGQGDA
ncbi:MAG: ComEC/Rec2 family competence protein, partial [Proteobacteria bacterium]|nr:ComEC/Rec2 family competence protein [Pseudomonadota bacterium]